MYSLGIVTISILQVMAISGDRPSLESVHLNKCSSFHLRLVHMMIASNFFTNIILCHCRYNVNIFTCCHDTHFSVVITIIIWCRTYSIMTSKRRKFCRCRHSVNELLDLAEMVMVKNLEHSVLKRKRIKENQADLSNQQECIPVGCVPPAAVAVSPAMHAPWPFKPPLTMHTLLHHA